MALQNNKRTTHHRSAFTLIELLVVISILLTVAVVVIPTVRTLNKDRKVRDTARVIGSVFSAARERAAVDGWAGVEIVSIPSNPDALEINWRYNIPNMGLVMYQLRAIPPIIGNNATVAGTTAMFPAGTLNEADDEISVNDYIEFNNNGVRYRIDSFDFMADPQTIMFDNGSTSAPAAAPNPPAGNPLPFKIHRQPKRISSSVLRLPNNMFLNMAWSGFGDAPTDVGTTGNVFQGRQFRDFGNNQPADYPMPDLDPIDYPLPEASTIIWFSKNGAIDLATSRGYHPGDTALLPGTPDYDRSFKQRPTGPLYFLLCSSEGDNVDLTNLDSSNFVLDKNNIWISVHHRNGSVHVNRPSSDALAVASPSYADQRDQVQTSRALVRKRKGSNP